MVLKEYKEDRFPPFIEAYNHFIKGDLETGIKQFTNLPEWFSKVELASGVGLTSPKTTSETTIYLEPGTYVMECYVRMPNGMPHVFYGMIAELVVTNENSGNEMPCAAHQIIISSTHGIKFVDTLTEGNYTFSVDYEDQKIYEHMLGHDVNVVKIENEMLLDSLNNWLNVADFNTFRSPEPKGAHFLGGVQDLKAGEKGFMNITLKKGHYVLISEMPNAMERNMFKKFEVYEN